MYSPSKSPALGAVEGLTDCRVPLVAEVGRLAGHARHRVHAPHRAVAPGRVEQPGREMPLGVVIAAGEQGLGFRATLAGQAAGLGQRCFHGPRRRPGHRHPPRHGLRVAERENAVPIIPPGLVVAFLEAETEVLPALDRADLGKRHPQSLPGDAAAKRRRADFVVPGQRRAKPPAGVEAKGMKTHARAGSLRGQPEVVGQVQFPAAGVVANAEKGGPLCVNANRRTAVRAGYGAQRVPR